MDRLATRKRGSEHKPASPRSVRPGALSRPRPRPRPGALLARSWAGARPRARAPRWLPRRRPALDLIPPPPWAQPGPARRLDQARQAVPQSALLPRWGPATTHHMAHSSTLSKRLDEPEDLAVSAHARFLGCAVMITARSRTHRGTRASSSSLNEKGLARQCTCMHSSLWMRVRSQREGCWRVRGHHCN